ncbi:MULTISPECIES: SDR family NAD(P)-dependent oxidoreductase [unclassified Mesorhizobium]|uniref:SDR family NAD(P)-dependent oxidoreductase n=1 Tax=unclassified Mesorhizobium TaxID=325217 RepID=UPI000FD7D431|nr:MULTISPECIES: SDR family NAD(P)-dependent oxidoreductase [unclassified Mesorhizobium]TGR23018.1 SDR family NAD(P)-dependent oxidoreductase [Mesorhizobium sp. M8A.F.Ca.ET.197.01.1.1]TGR39104.1 SDR family NAD(P)-dependent oxidoreductase [bacterium M00.F.Ca.ET.199.01.1.1]TGR46697.1 SDR family NAD(P)-dependent oxidoreductase [Mesorhizobium sp. M8A.F.Ca.ET.198.01.1.1]TGV85229.1 SDR family NAD(P)-dependent oxidoreductase [Mesorhizobium sp. M00.F.Ca.ET.149.01.1.1]
MIVDDFTGKVAFITGAGNGIGHVTAIPFARAGAAVPIVDIDADDSGVTAREVSAIGPRALVLTCDRTREAEVKAAFDAPSRLSGSRYRVQQRRDQPGEHAGCRHDRSGLAPGDECLRAQRPSAHA